MNVFYERKTMNTSNWLLLYAILTAGLLLSCDAVPDQMGEHQKLYENIAPVELPDYVKESNDTMMQKIVSLASLIDSSREKAIFPAFANSAGSTILIKSSNEEPFD